MKKIRIPKPDTQRSEEPVSAIRSLSRPAFTLVEVLAALTIGTMVLIIVLAIYNRAQTGAAAVIDKLENNRLPREILQRIAEDLDRIVSSGQDTKITVDNKFLGGFAAAKMEILRTVTDTKNQPQPLEKIVWQSSIEPDTGQLVLYRSHSGIALEDNLLDEQKEPWQRELFVPVCEGLSFFRIEIPKDNNVIDKWPGDTLPPAVLVTLSFAEPYKTADGTFDVPQEDKVARVYAIDRTRKPTFTLRHFDPNNLSGDANEPNKSDEPNEFNEPNNANEPNQMPGF